MKQVSVDYKNQVKELGREIDSIITYYNHYQVITENEKYILTEDGQKVLTEQIKDDSSINITAGDIYFCKVITHGDLLKTMMKEFDFEVKQDIKIGSIVRYKFGLKVNNSIEYVDYGMFIINQKEYNEDTQTYSYVAYDKMLFTMIPYKSPNLSEWVGIYTLYDLVQYVCEFCGLQLGVELFPNSEREITSDTLSLLESSNFTFRDVLDYATEVTGCSSYLIDNAFVIAMPTITQTDNLYNFKDLYAATSGISADDEGWITCTYNNTSGAVKYFNYWTNNLDVETSTDYKLIVEIKNVSGSGRVSFASRFNNDGQFTRAGTTFNNLQSGKKYLWTITSVNSFQGVNYGLRTFVYFFNGENGSITFRLSVLKDDNVNVNTFQYIPYGDLTLYADSFKDSNVKFNEVYGPINSILFSRSEDTDVIEIKDDESIANNGVTQIKIKDNPLLEGDDRSDYFEEMFDVLNGLTYSLNDVSTIGITYLEFNDKYKVRIDENEYDCLLLNDEINVIQGLEENIFTEEPEETTKDYVTSRLSDKDEKWANIHVKKDIGEINLEVGEKVGKDEVISAINLSPEQAVINSNKISLVGKTINLSSENIAISSNNFNVDADGHMSCSNATITGGNIVIPEGIGYGVEVHADSNNHHYFSRQRAGAFSLYKDDVLMGRIMDGSSTIGGVVQLYNTSGTLTIQANGTDGNVRCVSLTQTSLEDEKKNFKKFDNALQIVEDTDIYTYNLKNEDDDTKKHIGFVIGDKYNYRKEITSTENDGVDLYSMISVLWQAVKEQQKEIEELKERIDK